MRGYMADKFHSGLQDLKRNSLEMAHLGRTMLRSAVNVLSDTILFSRIQSSPEKEKSVSQKSDWKNIVTTS